MESRAFKRLAGWMVLMVLCVILGACAAPSKASPVDSAQLGLVLLDDENCVYVLAVSDQSTACYAGLEPGDYILSADGMAVTSGITLDEMLLGGEESLQLIVQRQGRKIELTLPCR